MSLDRDAICNYFLSLQDLIVSTLEKEDEKKFHVGKDLPGAGAEPRCYWVVLPLRRLELIFLM
jgi:hypothetical protein